MQIMGTQEMQQCLSKTGSWPRICVSKVSWHRSLNWWQTGDHCKCGWQCTGCCSHLLLYLGDMLSAGGGCELAIATRCCIAWGKFRKLLPLLTSKHISLKVRGKVFSACVRPAMLYGSETWALNPSDLLWLCCNNCAMIRWICGVKLEDEISSATLLLKLGIEDVTMVLQTRRLHWYGHMQRAESSINSITNLVIPGPRNHGRPRKTCPSASEKTWQISQPGRCWSAQLEPPGEQE